jgi:hypothetical protein|tara:strand:+ start:1820 stop:2080 length:261 start_codon:yes stop_codon:yes gene_type:complete
MIGEYYKESESVMRVVRIGQDLITKCENNELFAGNDDESYELWNAAVTAGNKMTTFGMVWSEFKSLSQLSSIEKKAVSFYLDNKDA